MARAFSSLHTVAFLAFTLANGGSACIVGRDDALDSNEGATGMSPTDGATADSAPQNDGSGRGRQDGGADAGDAASDDGATAGNMGGDALCETLQCGETCCESGQECVLGACLAACETEVRCGDTLERCCDEGNVCLQGSCVTPGPACLDSYDCPENHFCEPTLWQCLPQPSDVTCEIEPAFTDVEVLLEWSVEDLDIISIPVVADIDGDGSPDVVVIAAYHNDAGGEPDVVSRGIVVALDGRTGAEKFRLVEDPPLSYGAHGRSSLGLADVDGNGLPDIVYAGRGSSTGSRIHAVNGLGNLLWTSHDATGTHARLSISNGAPSFANFDGDFASEIVFGAAVLDNDGLLVWNEDGDGARFGSPSGYVGSISAIADLTGDGYPEVISGRHAFEVTWTDPGGGSPTVALELLWQSPGADGFPAVADIDLDGLPEVILVAGGTLRVLEGRTGRLFCAVEDETCDADESQRMAPIELPGGGRGGPPTVADFDGDGRPEVASAGAGAYTVFDFYREGEMVEVAEGDASPARGQAFVLWSQETRDGTSSSTGSSVFDFQGDGRAEVLYGDECYFRVYDGQSGDVVLEIPSSSATVHEYPIVVDVDADGNSEILVVANNAQRWCDDIEGYTSRRGLYVYGDPNDAWVRTRQVWPSHAYHVTNSSSAGLTPFQEDNNWEVEGLNNYRQNVQGQGIFNAADLSIDLSVDLTSCIDAHDTIHVLVTLRNEGALGVPAGVVVELYRGNDATGTLISAIVTDAPLLPGGFVVLSWPVPGPGAMADSYYAQTRELTDAGMPLLECREDNNVGTVETVACPPVG